jgi:hypothetical protein
MYAKDPLVMQLIPWMRALPERVALGSSSSTELGDVKTCLKPYPIYKFIHEAHEMATTYRNKELVPQ